MYIGLNKTSIGKNASSYMNIIIIAVLNSRRVKTKTLTLR